MVRRLVLAAALLLSAPRPSFSQASPQLDYFLTRLRPAAAAAHPLDGVGARLMWPVEAAIPVRGLRAGLYAMHLPADDGHEGWRFGAQTDATVLQFRPLPLQGLLTMGAGMVHSDLPAGAMLPPPTSPVRSLSPWRPRTDSETALSLSSGVAARLPISDGTAFRLDLRRVWDLGEIDAAATELSAGFTLPLRR